MTLEIVSNFLAFLKDVIHFYKNMVLIKVRSITSLLPETMPEKMHIIAKVKKR
jgi:hypothetical protein